MEEPEICRLCLNSIDEYIGLYHENGQPNEVHELMVHYFHSEMLSTEGSHLKFMCLECWRHIHEFHNYQVSIVQAQTKLFEEEKHVIIIEKVENSSTELFIGDAKEDSIYLIDEIPLSTSWEISETENIERGASDAEIDVVSEDGRNVSSNAIMEKNGNGEVTNDGGEKIEEIDVQYCSDPEVSIAECVIETSSYETENPPTAANNGNPVKDDTKKSTMAKRPNKKLRDKAALNEVLNAILSISTKSEHSSPNDSCDDNSNSEKEKANGKKRKSKRSNVQGKSSIIDNSNAEKARESDDIIAQWLPNLKCVICLESWQNFTLLKKHFRKMHPKEEFSIACCQRNFTYRCQLEEHVRLHLDPNAFRCKLCDKRFSSRANLCSHKQSQCIPTEKINERKPAKNIDKLVSQWRPVLECEVCSASSPSFSSLKDHFRQQHPNQEFYIVCCERKFSYRCHIEDHISLHLDSNIFKCDLCGKTFSKRNNLRNHKRVSHAYIYRDISQDDNTSTEDKQNARKTFKELDAVIAKWRPILECVVCKKPCSTFTQLSDHFRLKHKKSELYIKCCGRRFALRGQVEEHARLHLDPDSFKCEHCGKRFDKNFKLRTHKRLMHPVFETIFFDE